MNIQQAHQNLGSLLNHPDLKLNYAEHCALRQSLQLLHQKALDGEEVQKQLKADQKCDEILKKLEGKVLIESEKKEDVKDDDSNK